jgi:uncharacterized protein YjbI with pentapeptide repeats
MVTNIEEQVQQQIYQRARTRGMIENILLHHDKMMDCLLALCEEMVIELPDTPETWHFIKRDFSVAYTPKQLAAAVIYIKHTYADLNREFKERGEKLAAANKALATAQGELKVLKEMFSEKVREATIPFQQKIKDMEREAALTRRFALVQEENAYVLVNVTMANMYLASTDRDSAKPKLEAYYRGKGLAKALKFNTQAEAQDVLDRLVRFRAKITHESKLIPQNYRIAKLGLDVKFETTPVELKYLDASKPPLTIDILQGPSRKYNLRTALEFAVKEKRVTQGLDLRGAELQSAHLEGGQFQGCNFDGANLEGANLFGTNINKATFKGANLKRTIMDEVKGAKKATLK